MSDLNFSEIGRKIQELISTNGAQNSDNEAELEIKKKETETLFDFNIGDKNVNADDLYNGMVSLNNTQKSEETASVKQAKAQSKGLTSKESSAKTVNFSNGKTLKLADGETYKTNSDGSVEVTSSDKKTVTKYDKNGVLKKTTVTEISDGKTTTVTETSFVSGLPRIKTVTSKLNNKTVGYSHTVFDTQGNISYERVKSNYENGKVGLDVLKGYAKDGSVNYEVKDSLLGDDYPKVTSWGNTSATVYFDSKGSKKLTVKTGDNVEIDKNGNVTVTKQDGSVTKYDKNGILKNITKTTTAKDGTKTSTRTSYYDNGKPWVKEVTSKLNNKTVGYSHTVYDNKGNISYERVKSNYENGKVGLDVLKGYAKDGGVNYEVKDSLLGDDYPKVTSWGNTSATISFDNKGAKLKITVGQTVEIDKDGNVTVTKQDGTVTKYDKNGNEITIQNNIEIPEEGSNEFKINGKTLNVQGYSDLSDDIKEKVLEIIKEDFPKLSWSSENAYIRVKGDENSLEVFSVDYNHAPYYLRNQNFENGKLVKESVFFPVVNDDKYIGQFYISNNCSSGKTKIESIDKDKAVLNFNGKSVDIETPGNIEITESGSVVVNTNETMHIFNAKGEEISPKAGELGTREYFTELFNLNTGNNNFTNINYDSEGKILEFTANSYIYKINYNENGSFDVEKRVKNTNALSDITNLKYNSAGDILNSTQTVENSDGTKIITVKNYNHKREMTSVESKYSADGKLTAENSAVNSYSSGSMVTTLTQKTFDDEEKQISQVKTISVNGEFYYEINDIRLTDNDYPQVTFNNNEPYEATIKFANDSSKDIKLNKGDRVLTASDGTTVITDTSGKSKTITKSGESFLDYALKLLTKTSKVSSKSVVDKIRGNWVTREIKDNNGNVISRTEVRLYEYTIEEETTNFHLFDTTPDKYGISEAEWLSQENNAKNSTQNTYSLTSLSTGRKLIKEEIASYTKPSVKHDYEHCRHEITSSVLVGKGITTYYSYDKNGNQQVFQKREETSVTPSKIVYFGDEPHVYNRDNNETLVEPEWIVKYTRNQYLSDEKDSPYIQVVSNERYMSNSTVAAVTQNYVDSKNGINQYIRQDVFKLVDEVGWECISVDVGYDKKVTPYYYYYDNNKTSITKMLEEAIKGGYCIYTSNHQYDQGVTNDSISTKLIIQSLHWLSIQKGELSYQHVSLGDKDTLDLLYNFKLSENNSKIWKYAQNNSYDINNKTYMQNFIKNKEGLRLTAYDDKQPNKVLKEGDTIKGTLTIGYGHTGKVDNSALTIGTTITKEKAESLLDEDIQRAQNIVKNKVKVPLTQNQFDALTSLAYNCPSALKSEESSTLLRKLNCGDYEGAAEQFEVWVKSGGQVLQGLVERRKAEKELFLKDLPI